MQFRDAYLTTPLDEALTNRIGQAAKAMQKDYDRRHEAGGAIADPTQFLQHNVVHYDLFPNGGEATDRLTLHPMNAASRLPENELYHTRFAEGGGALWTRPIVIAQWRQAYDDICDRADRNYGENGWRWHPKVFYISSRPICN